MRRLIKKTYMYMLDEDYDIYIPALDNVSIELPYVSISNSKLTIHKGYAWNGCSPKFDILGLLVIGTPDGTIDYRTGKPRCYYASLVHDVLYQYELTTRKYADLMFLTLLQGSKFPIAKLYYLAVRIFGRRW